MFRLYNWIMDEIYDRWQRYKDRRTNYKNYYKDLDNGGIS